MTSAPNAATVEPITSEPVIVEASDGQKPTAGSAQAPAAEKPSQKVDNDLEDGNGKVEVVEYEREIPVRTYRQTERVITRSRSPGPHRYRGQSKEFIVLTNTGALQSLLDEPDACVETNNGQLVYLTNNEFHSADLQKISWIFTIGIPNSWAQKPISFMNGNRAQFEFFPGNARGRRYYEDFDDGYVVRGPVVPIARLGCALRIFKDDSDRYMTSKVKFVTVVGRNNSVESAKLIISHTRQAAMVDIFYEILNNHSILFVGAVLQDVEIPVEFQGRQREVKFQRVTSVKEAEEVGDGVVGVIC